MKPDKFPLCERHQLLRVLRGRFIVSSQALYDHLGNPKYQEFIETYVTGFRHPAVGFWPEGVEKFLKGLQ